MPAARIPAAAQWPVAMGAPPLLDEVLVSCRAAVLGAFAPAPCSTPTVVPDATAVVAAETEEESAEEVGEGNAYVGDR